MKLSKSQIEKLSFETNKVFEKDKTLISNYFDKETFIKNIQYIISSFSFNPWLKQREVFDNLKLKRIEDLKFLNLIIRNNDFFQQLITKDSPTTKYWNTILPFSERCEDVIQNKFKMPMRIAIFPGLSCMFYCGFCGRNQNAKYPSNCVDQSIKNFKNLFNLLDKNTKISISGGLEPFTNMRIGEIISSAYENGFKVPLITNGYNLTSNFIEKNNDIWKLDSIRFSLYGYDEDSYYFITRQKKSFTMVQKNLVELIKRRNLKNDKLKIGLNFIILNENMHNLSKVLDFVEFVNKQIDNGPGINFLTLRDDYQSVTEHSDNFDTERKYRLQNKIELNDRKKLINIIEDFEKNKNKKSPSLHVDYGYSLEFLKKGFLDKGLIKVDGKNIRSYGFSQLSVAIDTFGDVFLFREAGFLNRQGNSKVIIGRISDECGLDVVIKQFLLQKKPINFLDEDSRFLDSFDHVLNALVNQYEEDYNFGIDINTRPIRTKSFQGSANKGNNWYSDDI